jgi:hypothetical protein
MHIMVKYLNLEHSIQNISFLKYRIKHFSSEKMSAQVSFFSRGLDWNITELALFQLADILSVTLQASKKIFCIGVLYDDSDQRVYSRNFLKYVLTKAP